ncbi:MAG: histidine--tRNA ligase [Candidatus Pacebacteria bacterium]|nr:histidine--tRNA ligase [Candidatus Paceibacterota bacterium]
MDKNKFQNPLGMCDILPQDDFYYQKVINAGRKILDFYGFERLETPILEAADLFSRGIGESAEMVEKQMYVFRTRGKEALALRPEAAVPTMRAYLQHGMNSWTQPVRLWHFGSFFRYEKPQAGHHRQFNQFGLKYFGEKSPTADAQIILILTAILEELGLKNLTVRINTVGDSNCRPSYKKILLSFLKNRKNELCSGCQGTIKTNPLRIFNCKNEKCRHLLSEAPQIINHLCPECHQHFKEVLEILDEIKISYVLDPFLVRSFDYYTNTVFEVGLFPEKKEKPEKKETEETEDLSGAENEEEEDQVEIQAGSLAGGGRYDKLAKSLGAEEDIPACGWNIGVERVIEAMKAKKIRPKSPTAQIFLAQIGILAKRKTLRLLEDFRKERIKIFESLGRDSLKNQLARASDLGAKYTLILGQKEALSGEIIIRNMENGQQVTVDQKDIIKEIKKRL